MNEDELRAILEAHAREFAEWIVNAIRVASLGELGELTSIGAAPVEGQAVGEFADAAPPSEPELPGEGDETEVSVLEHLNGAGPKGSTLRAWIISTHGELDADEHAHWEREGQRALDTLVDRGLISSKDGGKMRGTVYTLLPIS